MTSTDGTERKVCLDLFAGLGGFSSAFEESEEWDVYTVELNPEFDPDLCADVVELSPDDLLELIGLDREEIDVLVILASPPCTYFSTAGNHDSGTSRSVGRSRRGRETRSHSSSTRSV